MSDTIQVMKKDALIQIKVTPELRDALAEVAARENLTTSRLLLISAAKQYPELTDLVLKH